METSPQTATGTPPRLITSIVAGFNITANHIVLVLLPVIFDIFLWTGPHLKLTNLFLPAIKDFFAALNQLSSPDMSQFLSANQAIWESTISQINLFSSLRTFPVGVPSLFASLNLENNPFGPVRIFQLETADAALLSFVLILLAGVVAGSFYFNFVAAFSSGKKIQISPRIALWETMQTIALTLCLLVILFFTMIPLLLLLAVFAAISPSLAQIAFIIIGLLFIWFVIPLVFSAHGIFSFHLNAIVSLMTSVRLVRFFLPGTSVFLVVAILLNEGLNILWRVPPSDSWMSLVGIFGHGFITTALMCASFIYYLGGMRWMHENLQKLSKQQAQA